MRSCLVRLLAGFFFFRAILHDPDVYPDPEAFKPERFLTEDGELKEDPSLMCAFGFGRRFVSYINIFIVFVRHVSQTNFMAY